MLPRIREQLALLLIVLLPFHALLVTVLTKAITGPGHAPMSALAVWKEGLLGLVLMIAVMEIVQKKNYKKIDVLDVLILCLLGLSLIVSFLTHGSLKSFVLGFRYDFIPLITFLILRRVPWSEKFKKSAMNLLLIVGSIIAAYGLLTLILPDSFFRLLGYSDLHSLYVPGGPIAAFQNIGGSALRRMQSTFSGPNQMGLWMLVSLGVGVVRLKTQDSGTRKIILVSCVLCLIAILLSFSRAAWIGAVVIGVTGFRLQASGKWKILLPVACGLCLVAFLFFPNIILRAASSRDHLAKPLEAIHIMIQHPLGLGLGTAGPASNRTSDACVSLEEGADASWATAHPQLCVFVGDEQVQPIDRTCNCPLLPENAYLQIGVELGWIGMILFIMLIVLVIRLTPYPLRFTLLAVATAGLFLHVFEDSALSYTLWILIASVLSPSFGLIQKKMDALRR